MGQLAWYTWLLIGWCAGVWWVLAIQWLTRR